VDFPSHPLRSLIGSQREGVIKDAQQSALLAGGNDWWLNVCFNYSQAFFVHSFHCALTDSGPLLLQPSQKNRIEGGANK
jgi:hypothetical protein